MEVVEVAVALADRAERVPNSATSAQAVSRKFVVPWSTENSALHFTLVPLQDSDCAATELHDPQQRLDFALQFLVRMEVHDTWPENILWTDGAHFTL